MPFRPSIRLVLALGGPVVAGTPALPEAPPSGLACLAKWYGVEPVKMDGAWRARLPGGAEYPWDDGREKSFEEKLDAPDLEDTNRQSAHSYGVSIDLNVKRSHYWEWAKPKHPVRWANRIPQVLVDAFEAEGFIWGGRWYHYDTMHFEYRPELLDPECLPSP